MYGIVSYRTKVCLAVISMALLSLEQRSQEMLVQEGTMRASSNMIAVAALEALSS